MRASVVREGWPRPAARVPIARQPRPPVPQVVAPKPRLWAGHERAPFERVLWKAEDERPSEQAVAALDAAEYSELLGDATELAAFALGRAAALYATTADLEEAGFDRAAVQKYLVATFNLRLRTHRIRRLPHGRGQACRGGRGGSS